MAVFCCYMLRNGKDETYKHEFDIEVVLCKKLADVISDRGREAKDKDGSCRYLS